MLCLAKTPLLFSAFMVIAIAVAPQRSSASHGDGASAFSIDMDPSGNTATSLGSRQVCASITYNGIQDADEDVVDGLTIDITATQIPAVTAAVGFGYALYYPESALTLSTSVGGYLLASNAGSGVFDASDPAPDTDGDNRWIGGEVDLETGTSVAESGSGVLQRDTITADAGASTGVYDLTLAESGHIDEYNGQHAPDTLENARLAVNIACPPADTDGDKVYDVDEAQCGSDPYSAASRPERIDGVYAGVSDDGDAQIDEALPTNIPMADCDGDGFAGTAENFVFAPSTEGDQDPCGTAPLAAPFNVPIGWPADLRGGGIPNSTNRINVGDIASFLAPVRRLDTSPGDAGYDPRWDVVPGNSGQAKDINSADYNYVSTFAPAMLNSVRAMNGPPCPWP